MTEAPLVVDANVLFSALLRDSTTRRLILDGGLDLYAPVWLWEEADARRDFLLRKSRLPPAVFDGVWAALRERIETIPVAAMVAHAGEARRRCRDAGAKDAPYVACALAVDGAIWTHDGALRREAGVPVVTTAELL